MLNMNKKCIHYVLHYVKAFHGVLWHCRKKHHELCSGSPLKGGIHRYTYYFQLVQWHCGICRSINQEQNGDGRQLCLFTTLKTTSIYPH